MLGIDLRITSVKVVEIERKDGSYVLKNWGMTEVPYALIDKHPQLEDAKADALGKLVASNKIAARSAVVVAAGSDTIVKVFSLAELPRSEAADAIKWKFAEEISYPAEEAIISFYPLPKGEVFTEKTDYLAACVNRNFFLETQYILNKAGLKLAGITVLPDALRELYREEISKPDEKIASIIYMGKRSTNISIYRHGLFEFNRELTLGGENITRAMSGILVSPEGQVEVSPEEAERIKVEYGLPLDLEHFPKVGEIPLIQLQAMVRPALEKVQSEVARTFEYYKGLTGEGAVGKIILTGGSSLTPNLKEFLSAGLGAQTITPEPFPKLDPRLAAALGAALTGGRSINLLPEEIKFPWAALSRKLLKPQYIVSAFAGFLALIYLFFWLRAFGLHRELAYINGKMDQYRPRLARLDAIEKATQEEERKKLTIKTFEQNRSQMPAVFEEISRLIPSSVIINNLSVTIAEVHVWGAAFRKDEAAETTLSRFVLGLSRSPLFEAVKLVQAAKNYDYATEAFNFELLAKIRKQ